jgi:Icc-related predicted phosphoesterase
MRAYILADLHNEFSVFQPPSTDADIVVLAGEIDVGIKGLQWAHEVFRDKIIIYVAGNHEFYFGILPTHTQTMRQRAGELGIHFLENDSLTVGDVTFLGCTLWTDFNLFGNAAVAMLAAEQDISDYRVVQVAPGYRKLRARDTVRLHKESMRWLREEIARHGGRQIIVVSHHAPSLRSVAERFKADVLSAAFASRLDEFIDGSGIRMWIHGHVHKSVTYDIGSTKIICNVRGYPRELDSGFDPDLIIDV